MRPLLVPLLLVPLACKTDPAPKTDSPGRPESPLVPAGQPRSTGDVRSASSGLMPQQVAAHTLDRLPDGHATLGPFSIQVPAGWQEKPSTSSMRAAQFDVTSSEGKAELVVYHFGDGGAGTVQDNIDRWLDQFEQQDGKSSREVAHIEQTRVAGQEASLVSVSGRYVAPAMPGGERQDKPDQSLLAAIVPSPHGPYYFRLVGDRAAVAARTSEFRALLGSLTLR